MSFRLRATGVLLALIGFFALGFAAIAGIAVLDAFLATHRADNGALFEGALIAATAVVALGILRGMFVFLRAGRLTPLPHALAVTPGDQPELWAEIHAVAEATGERVPDELFLDFDANAGVKEHNRLLGLLPGRRRMIPGAPLVACLTVPQLRAVVAHEFGHYATRLGGVAMRGRAAMVHTVEHFAGNLTWFDRAVLLVYVRYTRFYLRLSQSVARDQELAADRGAVRHAGPDAIASALRALPVLAAARARYLDTYATMGEPVGALPSTGEFYGGYLRFLAARPADRLAVLTEGQRPRRPHKYDSHPSDAERLAAIGRTSEAGAPVKPDVVRPEAAGPEAVEPAAEPALALLRDPARVLADLEAVALLPEASRRTRLSWDDLVLARARHDAETWSRPLQQTVLRAHGIRAVDAPLPDLDAVLDAFDAGILWTEIVPRLPKPAAAGHLSGAAARTYARPRLFDALAGLVHLRLLDAGEATPAIAWEATPGLVLPPAWESGMDAALDAATADTPDTAPLRALLASADARSAEA